MPSGKGKRDPKLEKAASGADTKDNKEFSFKPAHVKKLFKKFTKMRVSKVAIFACMAAVNYIMSEIIDGAKSCCEVDGKKKIYPRHINKAIVNDSELKGLMKNYVIQAGGFRTITGDVAEPSVRDKN